MARSTHRLNVTLDAEHAEKLRRLAERTNVQEGTLARSLLSGALEEADPEARDVAELLESIDGAFERAQQGLAQARAGRTVPLDEL
jgi:predicted transcriptional regulator